MTTPRHAQPEPLPAAARAFALLDRGWNGLIIEALAKGPADFDRIRERVPGITDHVLTDRLRQLTTADLVVPTARHYALTPHGNAFLIPLAALIVWAEDHLPA